MVMISATSYTTTGQSTNSASNQNAKQEENCWREAESDSMENVLLRNEVNDVSDNDWKNGGDMQKAGGRWRWGEQSKRGQWTKSMVENAGRDVLRQRESDPERNLWRTEKCKSMGNFWPDEKKSIENVWRSSSKDNLDRISWSGKEGTKKGYIWRNPAGQLVSPIGSQLDVGVQYVSIVYIRAWCCLQNKLLKFHGSQD